MSVKELVQKIFQTNTNYNEPEQAINQAESLKSLSSDLYTDSKRFIYELLQNADDSGENGRLVNVEIKLFNNILVVAHNGKGFDSSDIKGICNINNGTKKSSIEKTGYKGIGFKSVFGQSDKVIIFSNGEYFKFDANHDFGWKEEWSSNKDTWEIENNRKFVFPWQIIPIYTFEREIEQEIQTFLKTDWNVATIIELFKKDDVQNAIEELASNVNMFLFLKNINSIKFTTDQTIEISIDRKTIGEYTLSKNKDIKSQWIIRTVHLEVTDELKNSLQNERNIPDKLLQTNKIELTMAIQKGQEGLKKLATNESLLYAYLPTDEKRYSLPILVNTTFLMSANRESLHADSKWNQWLFKSISLELFKWIASLIKGEYSYQAYQLMPIKLSTNDELSREYNRGIDEAVETIPFILSKENELLKVKEALIDSTFLSEKTFIGSEVVRKFIIHKIGSGNAIVEKPFVMNTGFNSLLEKIGVETFKWNDVPAFFAFEDFLSEHTVDKNIELIQYFKNESELKDPVVDEKKLKSLAFIYDHKNKLTHPNNVYFPAPDDKTWNNPESSLSFLHQKIQTWLLEKQKSRKWLEKLGVVEKTDISFLEKTIIPNCENYITNLNAIETIQTIYSLYKKEKIEDRLRQLADLKLLTKNEHLISASECFFSDEYTPKLKIEENIKDDIFLSEKYLDVINDDKDEIKRFFKYMGVQEDISIFTIKEKTSNEILINYYEFEKEYFNLADKKFSPVVTTFTADTYQDINTLSFLSKTNSFQFSKLFWNTVIQNINLTSIQKLPRAYWGNFGYPSRITGNLVGSYLKWYVQNIKCIPTKKGFCDKSISVFINSDEMIKLAGKYLPVFDSSIELTQDWKAFFSFKTEFQLEDYLELLTAIFDDKTDENKLQEFNKKRVQEIFYKLLVQSNNWNTAEIEKVKTWAESTFLTDEDCNIVEAKHLKYYADGDTSIFQEIYQFIGLNEENKAHQNIENLLEYFGIEILRQDNFDIELEGDRLDCDLKDKLENIFPYLENWIVKVDSEFSTEQLKEVYEKLEKLDIFEATKLSLSYDGNILKTVQLHLDKNELLVTKPWFSNKVLISLPKVLCDYFNLKGYEDKLEFLLRENDFLEINEYFENEGIKVPEIQVPVTKSKQKVEPSVTLPQIDTPQALASFGITNSEEYEKIKLSHPKLFHNSTPTQEMYEAAQKLIERAVSNIKAHLITLDEYKCEDIEQTAPTVLGGITKNGRDISVVGRPSDDGKIVIGYYESEIPVLELDGNELWYEDGKSEPKQLTLGELLKKTEITRIPV
ncbi:MAG: transcriptional regulator [Campylobacterales bacterium]|nr:transcriptional regulator [Campylobacterales bacterium]